MALSNFLLVSALLTQKYSRDPESLFKKAQMIFETIAGALNKKDLVQAIIVYYMQQIDKKDVKIIEIIEEFPQNVKEFVMSTYDMILQKGMQKGKQEGIQEGEEKRNLILLCNVLEAAEIPLPQVATLFEMDLEEVKTIEEKLNSGEWTHPKLWADEEWNAYFSK